MKNAPQKIQMHPLLWKLHGKRAYPKDLILTYTAAILVAAYNLILKDAGPAWKTVVLLILSLDIGGGVVSNFSQGTIGYYRESTLSPHVFIWLHLFQSLALIGVFPHSYPQILLVTLATLTAASFTVYVQKGHSRTVISTFLLVVVLLLAIGTAAGGPLLLLLVLLPIKLIAGFAAHQFGIRRAD